MANGSMLMRLIRGLALTGLVVAVPAQAQQAAKQATGRYTMQAVEGGALRLDTDTGQVSMCKAMSGGQWQCSSLPDERAALEQEIARLSRENQELQGAVKRLEELAGLPPDARTEPGRRADKGGPGPGGMHRLPTEQDVDQVMSYLRGMLKKFKDKLKEFEDLEGKPTERL